MAGRYGTLEEPLAGVDDPRILKNAAKDVRMGFVRKVYGILTAQLLLTVVIGLPFQFLTVEIIESLMWMYLLSMVLLVATMCSMCCCAENLKTYPTNYAFLLVLTVCMGVMVGFGGAMYSWQSVVLAAGITVGIFICMTMYAWNTTTDFTGYGPYLMGAVFALLVMGLALCMLSLCGVFIQWVYMLYNLLAVLLFTFYIVFDTQIIIGGRHEVEFSIDDYCFAALTLYLDIINLFLHLLSLLGDRR